MKATRQTLTVVILTCQECAKGTVEVVGIPNAKAAWAHCSRCKGTRRFVLDPERKPDGENNDT
jgi:hypothetical protein